MKTNSAPAADSRGRVGELQRRAQDARKRADQAKKEARDAKQRAREARRLFKEAKKVAKNARKELAALSNKLKKLIENEPRARGKGAERAARDRKKAVTGKAGAAAAATTKSVAKSRKSRAKRSRPKSAQATDSPRKRAKPKSVRLPKAKFSTASESGAAESQPSIPRRSRATRKSVPNGSIEAVVDISSAGDAPARTSEETLAVEPEGQNTPEESVA